MLARKTETLCVWSSLETRGSLRGDGREKDHRLVEACAPTRLQFEESGAPTENGPIEHLEAPLGQHLARFVLTPEDASLGDAAKQQIEDRPFGTPDGIADAFEGALGHGGGEQRSGLEPSKNVDHRRKGLDAVSLGDDDLESAFGKKGIPGLAVDGACEALRRISAELAHVSENVPVHEG